MSFRAPISPAFHRYFRGWNRLEPRSRSDDFQFGLHAATADGPFMLGRQRQLREFQCENAGTAIHVTLTTETAQVDQVALGTGSSQAIGAIPVEVLVEREQVEWDWRLRIRAGQQFERLARANDLAAESIIAQLRTSVCPVVKPALDSAEWAAMDLATRRFVSVMAGRAIDGKTLFEKIRANDGAIPPTLRTLAAEWFGKLYSQGPTRMPPAWNSEKLDYTFSLQSSNSALPGPLTARSYRNGSLDWHTFDLTKPGSAPLSSAETKWLTPTHAMYAGQPQRRWWEFEDSAVQFGALNVATTHIVTLLLAEFAITNSDDYFVIPAGRVAPGSLIRVTKLECEDCFQQKTRVEPARVTTEDPLDRWDAFVLAPARRGGASSDFLFVPPIAGTREESPILESIYWAKDEDANLTFAVETTVPNGLGDPVNGLSAHREALQRLRQPAGPTIAETTEEAPSPETTGPSAETDAPGVPDAVAQLKFVFSTDVPPNWIPFIASDARDALGLPYKSVKLRRAEFVSTAAEDERRRIDAQSHLLKAADGSALESVNEEAIGREGVRVELRRQRMRTSDGETYVWLGRKVGLGKGEARSGLRHDAVENVG